MLHGVHSQAPTPSPVMINEQGIPLRLKLKVTQRMSATTEHTKLLPSWVEPIQAAGNRGLPAPWDLAVTVDDSCQSDDEQTDTERVYQLSVNNIHHNSIIAAYQEN